METRNREIVSGGSILSERQIDPLNNPQERGRFSFQKITEKLSRLPAVLAEPPTILRNGRALLLAVLVVGVPFLVETGIASADFPQPARNKAELTLGDQLEVSQDWLLNNPTNVQVAEYIKNAAGQVTGRVVVVNNSLMGPQSGYKNSVLYGVSCDPVSEECGPSFEPEMELPMENAGALAVLDDQGKRLLIAGEVRIRRGDTKLLDCSRVTKTCQTINWPYGQAGVTNALLKIDETTYLGINGNYEGAVGQYLARFDTASQSVSVQAVRDAITALNLKSVGAPQIEVDVSSNTLRELAAASGRLATGLDAATINYKDATASTENSLPRELGYVYGFTTYADSKGKHYLASNLDFDFIAGGDIDPVTGKPGSVNYKIYYDTFLDNSGIPDLLKGRVFIPTLWVGADNQDKVRIVVIGSYPTYILGKSTTHGFVAEFIKGTDPNIDPNALFRQDLGPADRDIFQPSQRQVRSREVKGQPGLEFPVRWNVDDKPFGGLVRYSMNPDYSPNANAPLSYPNNGLQKALQAARKYTSYLPALFKQFSAGW